MAPISTNLPKMNSNFSIDWIVKNDKNSITNNNNSISKSNEHPTPQEDILVKDYDRELSKALRLSPYGDTGDRTNRPMPRDDTKPKLDEYLHRSMMAHEPVRQMPAVPSLLEQQKMSFDSEHGMAFQSSLAAMQHSQIINAQLQMAAALSHQHRQATQRLPQTMDFSQIFHSNFQRTPYPLQPWLMNRHGRVLPHGFTADFLLHPYRKPKRIRTAFAPLQLLELENAFEGNQYVVGAERKTLAKNLNLSETQVNIIIINHNHNI